MQTGSGHIAILEIARSGFRFTFERPWLIAAWALTSFTYNVLGSVFAAAIAGPAITRIFDMVGQANPDPNAAAPLLTQIAPAYAVLMVPGLMVNAVYLASANRALSRPAADRSGYIGLGRDVLLQFGLLLILTAVGFGVVLALLLISTGLGVLLTPANARLLAMLVAILGLGYVWLRFSLASPATYSNGRIDLLHAWTSTAGRVWLLARVYLFVLLLSGVVYLLGAVAIEKGMSAALGGEGAFDALTRFDFRSPLTLLTPARLVLSALYAVLSALILPVLLCPSIAIYRALTPTPRPTPSPATGGASPWG